LSNDIPHFNGKCEVDEGIEDHMLKKFFVVRPCGSMLVSSQQSFIFSKILENEIVLE
jgi:hypothetical protein